MINKIGKIGIILFIVGMLFGGIQTTNAHSYDQNAQDMTASGWFYVGGGGPGNYTTIQSAINAASNGDTIYVYSGTFNENIVIDKSLMVLGEDRNTTIIKGNGLNATVTITGIGSYLKGFTITNDGLQDGIYTSTNDHTFTDNIITKTLHGINLYYSSENTMLKNLFINNTKTGIFIQVGQNNTISENEFYDNSDEGLYLTGCGTTRVEKNAFYNNGKGIHAYRANGNIIRNNVIQFNSYGIYFAGSITVHSNYNTISHNTISNNTISGVRIENSQFNRIEFNEISGNNKGIDFWFTGANLIKENVIASSLVTEITLSFSLGDLITKNNIDNSQQSLVLLQINIGFSFASNNWWGSSQWPLRRIRPIAGWVIILPWTMGPFNLSVGPEP